MVDADRLARILQLVGDDVALLRGYENEDILADAAELGHVKYLFVTAIEGLVDAAHHVCASEGWGPPDTNADTMEVPARHGVLDAGRLEHQAATRGRLMLQPTRPALSRSNPCGRRDQARPSSTATQVRPPSTVTVSPVT